MTAPRQTVVVPAIASRDAAGDAPIPTSSISAGFPKSASDVPPPTAHAVIETKDRDSYAVTAIADITDRSLHAAIARFTSGISPAALAHAYSDWATHLTYAPGKRLQLLDKAMRKAVDSPTMPSQRNGGRKDRILHRTVAAGQAFRWRRLASMALQFYAPGLSAPSAMVA